MKKAMLCVVDENGDSIKDIALIDLAKSNNDYSLEHTNMKAPIKTKLITVQDIDGNFITFSTEELIDSDVIETPFVEELKSFCAAVCEVSV